MRRLSLILAFALILTACVEQGPASSPSGAPVSLPGSLKEAAASSRLLIGTNTDRPVGSYEETYGAVISREFNALSTTASMWMIVHPARDRWDFSFLDEVVGFAQRNNLKVIGTPILWGAEGDSPDGRWYDYDPSYLNDGLTADEARRLMRDHITTLVGRYRGRVHEWVVANEVVDPSSPTGTRQDIFAKKLGTVDYLAEAFRLVHELDPQAVLILNEGYAHGPTDNADRLYRLVQELLRRGAPIHAVGLQTHWTNFEKMPSFEEMRVNLERFAALGVQIRLTEVDVMVGHLPVEEREAWQKGIYRGVVSTCLAVAACKGITFWGFTDRHNWWIDEMGYTDEQPLLFDAEYRRKPSYFGVLDALMGRS